MNEIKMGQILFAIADVWDEPAEIPVPMIVIRADGDGYVLCVDPGCVVALGVKSRDDDEFVMSDDKLREAVDQRRAALRVERRRLGVEVFETEREAIEFAQRDDTEGRHGELAECAG